MRMFLGFRIEKDCENEKKNVKEQPWVKIGLFYRINIIRKEVNVIFSKKRSSSAYDF